jgi:pimeloyl-ACP methyl ester carboxylesterase
MTNTASAPLQALGVCLEEYEYPYPVRFLQLANDLQPAAMAYMGHSAGHGFRRATRVVIPDCGHIPHLEHPSQFLAELLPFPAS